MIFTSTVWRAKFLFGVRSMANTTNALMVLFFDTLLDNISATATFTPPSGYSLENLKSPELRLRTRTPDLTPSQRLMWNLIVARTFNAFALIGSNAFTFCTRRFVAASNAPLTANVVESGPSETAAFDPSLTTLSPHVPLWGRTLIYILPASVSRQFVAWYQSDPTNPDGYMQWSTARLGLGWQPQCGFQQWKSTPIVSGPPGLRRVLREHEFTLGYLTRQEAYEIQSIAMSGFGTKRLLVIPEPLRPATWPVDAIWCTLESAAVKEPLLETTPDKKLWRVVLTFTEVDR